MGTSLISKLKTLVRRACICVCTEIIRFFFLRVAIKPNLIYMQSRDGLDFAGNLLKIAVELQNAEYQPKKIVLYVIGAQRKHACRLRARYGLANVRIITNKLAAACYCEIAKYLFTDSSMLLSYIKREGQVVVNTWHGTPLKHMAKDSPSGRIRVGGGQRAQLMADYLVYPSPWMCQTMQRAYMIDGIYEGTNLFCGYPRNSVLRSEDSYRRMRDALGLAQKQVFAYLPTFRGTMDNIRDRAQTEILREILTRLDGGMSDRQVMLVKLHVFNRKQICFDNLKHIVPWPEGYETYDILSAADCLITDYSSVFFDYANTGRKIILFPYDRAEYLKDRGIYIPLEALPFPKVETTEALLAEMALPKQYDDREFLATFTTYDCADAARKLCRRVLLGEHTCEETRRTAPQKNVMLYGGSLAKNGITTAYRALLQRLDKAHYHYVASFRQWQIMRSPQSLSAIPADFDYLPIFCPVWYGIWEEFAWLFWKNRKNADPPKILLDMFRREWQRCYPGVHFEYVIDFDGYGVETMMLLKAAPAKKMTWVHSDMLPELQNRTEQHRGAFRYTYRESQAVAVVSPDLKSSVRAIADTEQLPIDVIPNLFDDEGTVRSGAMPLATQPDTEIWSGNPQGLTGVLSDAGKKFVAVGRFAPEKAHLRLIEAFELFSDETPGAQLIIIGGHGDLYERTLQRAQRSRVRGNITIVKSIANPMPILRSCDLFIFCSLYEGPSRAILEADCLGLPVIATDGVGVHPMMTEYGGYLTPNSTEGLVQAMRDFMAGKVPPKLAVNHTEKNMQAMDAFVRALDGSEHG